MAFSKISYPDIDATEKIQIVLDNYVLVFKKSINSPTDDIVNLVNENEEVIKSEGK